MTDLLKEISNNSMRSLYLSTCEYKRAAKSNRSIDHPDRELKGKYLVSHPKLTTAIYIMLNFS